MFKKIFDAGLILMLVASLIATGVVLYKTMPPAKELVLNEKLRVTAKCAADNKKACAYLAQVERTK